MIVTDFFEALHVGKELSNAKTWKNAQLIVNKLTAFGCATLGIMRVFGYDMGLTDDQVFTLASAIGVLVSVFNGTATVVSTTRVGLSPSDSNALPGIDDGVRSGTTEGRPHEWVRELDNRDQVQMSDMRDRG